MVPGPKYDSVKTKILISPRVIDHVKRGLNTSSCLSSTDKTLDTVFAVRESFDAVRCGESLVRLCIFTNSMIHSVVQAKAACLFFVNEQPLELRTFKVDPLSLNGPAKSRPRSLLPIITSSPGYEFSSTISVLGPQAKIVMPGNGDSPPNGHTTEISHPGFLYRFDIHRSWLGRVYDRLEKQASNNASESASQQLVSLWATIPGSEVALNELLFSEPCSKCCCLLILLKTSNPKARGLLVIKETARRPRVLKNLYQGTSNVLVSYLLSALRDDLLKLQMSKNNFLLALTQYVGKASRFSLSRSIPIQNNYDVYRALARFDRLLNSTFRITVAVGLAADDVNRELIRIWGGQNSDPFTLSFDHPVLRMCMDLAEPVFTTTSWKTFWFHSESIDPSEECMSSQGLNDNVERWLQSRNCSAVERTRPKVVLPLKSTDGRTRLLLILETASPKNRSEAPLSPPRPFSKSIRTFKSFDLRVRLDEVESKSRIIQSAIESDWELCGNSFSRPFLDIINQSADILSSELDSVVPDFLMKVIMSNKRRESYPSHGIIEHFFARPYQFLTRRIAADRRLFSSNSAAFRRASAPTTFRGLESAEKSTPLLGPSEDSTEKLFYHKHMRVKWTRLDFNWWKMPASEYLNFFEWSFQSLDLHESIDRFDYSTGARRQFFFFILRSYRKENPYHNSVHAIQVYHTLWILLSEHAMSRFLEPLEIYGLLIAGFIHDVDHPGVTNQFLSACDHPLAIRYNDRSVLEHYHSAFTFEAISSRPDINFLHDCDTNSRRTIRRHIIDFVLATDMQSHSKMLAEFNKLLSRIEEPNDDSNNSDESEELDKQNRPGSADWDSEDRSLLGCILIHACDLSNQLLPFPWFTNWASLCVAEFNQQTDKEYALNMEVTGYMNCRTEKSRIEMELGFLEFVVLPLWRPIIQLESSLRPWVDQGERNSTFWRLALKKIKGEDIEESDFLDESKYFLRNWKGEKQSLFNFTPPKCLKATNIG